MPSTSPPTTRHVRPVWQDAYDAQMGVWRWYRTPEAMKWLMGLWNEAIEGATPDFRKTMTHLYDAELGRLLDCDPVYVSEEMCQVVDVARHSFAPEAIQLSDLVTPRGFLYYAQPLQIPDRHGRPLWVRAAAWSQQYTMESEDRSILEERIERIAEMMENGEGQHGARLAVTELDQMVSEGILEPHGIMIALYADREGYVEAAARRGHDEDESGYQRTLAQMQQTTAGTPLVTMHVAPWQYGMTFEGNEVDVLGLPTGAAEWWKLLQATFRLMQQRLAHKSLARPQRARWREGARLGFPPDTEVVIVRLRKEQSERHDPSGEEANYSHRFIVGAHWRNQWYPSDKIHRQIWIAPYVKGPEDKPLIVRPRRVFQWQR